MAKAFVFLMPRIKPVINGNNGTDLWLHWIASKRPETLHEYAIPTT